MSEAASKTTSETTLPSSQPLEPQLGTPPAEPTRGLSSSGLRFEDDPSVPQWARGKTAKEILDMTQTVMSRVGQPQMHQQPPQQTQQPQVQTPTPQSPQLQPPNPELSYTDPQEYNRQLAEYVRQANAQALQQQSAPFVNQAADTALHLSKNGRFKAIWDRWEPEVMAELAQVPRQHWSISILDKAAQLVKANHTDELIREEAERMASNFNTAGVGIEGTSPSSTPAGRATLPLDVLFEENHPAIERFKEAGLRAPDIRQRLSAMGTTEEEYVENLKKSHIVANGRYSQVEAQSYR